MSETEMTVQQNTIPVPAVVMGLIGVVTSSLGVRPRQRAPGVLIWRGERTARSWSARIDFADPAAVTDAAKITCKVQFNGDPDRNPDNIPPFYESEKRCDPIISYCARAGVSFSAPDCNDMTF